MKASTSNWFSSIALAIAVLGAWAGVAEAGGRKRVVVLEFEGPKAEKFHDDLVKLIKKNHTVVPIDKWNGTAEELDAGAISDKNLKKIAKKLKVDAIIQGKIEKRRDEFLIKLKLRAGKSGELVGAGVDTKADGPRIDGKASQDIKDELIDAIDGMGSNRGGGGDDGEDEEEKPSKKKAMKKDEDAADDEEKPSKKKSAKKDEEDEEKPVKKGFGKKDKEEDEEEKPVKKGFSRKNDDETAAAKVGSKKSAKKDDEEDEEKPTKKKSAKKDEEDESPLPKSAKKRPSKSDEEQDEDGGKKVANKDEEEEDGGSVEGGTEGDAMESAVALSPGERGIDVVAGVSFNARRLGFAFDGDLASKPPGYKGVPVAGVLLDATVFPLAVGHKRTDMLKNLGLTVMYDKVLKINSKSMGMTLPTSEARYAIGAVFRYPLGKGAMAPVIAGSLRYGRQSFTITGTVDIPNVNYTIIDPAVTFKYPVSPKVILNANLGFMLITGTGAIQKNDEYGAATVKGFEGEFGGDYLLTKNIFARAAFKFEAISFTFKGTGAKTTGRDGDPAQDVQGANDNYFGGAVTVGYLY